MIPYAFDYERARTVDEALSFLSGDGAGEVKLLAGGHSLIPAMKLRLSAPGKLVDISGIEELTQITEEEGRLRIGALATHQAIEMSDLVRRRCGVLAEAASRIGDPQVRNRGTLGGSLAHADPAADYPALVLALGAEIEARSASGTRRIAADDCFQGMFTTAVEADEMITAVFFPVLEGRTGAAYEKFANPASRYAVVGVAALVRLGEDETCETVRIGVTGAAPAAFRAEHAEGALTGKKPEAKAIAEAVESLADPADLMSDLSGSAEYRAHLCSVLARRALTRAVGRAGA